MSLRGNIAVDVIRDFFDNTRLMKILAIVLYHRKSISGTRLTRFTIVYSNTGIVLWSLESRS